jgi:uncharacterized protein (DUF433 family)
MIAEPLVLMCYGTLGWRTQLWSGDCYRFTPMRNPINWSECPDVERRPGVVSGAWVVIGTRIPADALVDNAGDGYTAEQIATDIYEGLPVDRARRIISFARQHVSHPA